MPQKPAELVNLFKTHNGWIRDKAQQMLVDKKDTSIADVLRNNLQQPDNELALFTLYGRWKD